MSKVVGFVKSLQNGLFFAKDAQGAIRELKAGDQVLQNELVYGAPNNPQNAQVIIDVTLTDAKDITLLASAELYMDLSVIGGAFEKEEAVVSKDSLENAWKLSTDTPNQDGQVDAPAAGLEETAAGEGLSDTERPGGQLFNARTGTIGDVSTILTQDTVNGGVDVPFNGVNTLNLNDQPIVSNVTGAVSEARDGLNLISGQLVASDVDVEDTHTFFAVEGSLLLNGAPAPEGLVFVLNPDGTYSVSGDFNALAIDENAVITFQYYAVDNGIDVGAPHASLPATVTITVNGTNDQPMIEDINVNGGEIGESGLVGYYDMYEGSGTQIQQSILEAGGFSMRDMDTLDINELNGLSVLYIDKYNSNSEYTNNLSNINNAVFNGMTLIINDGSPYEANTILPGLGTTLVQIGANRAEINIGPDGGELAIGAAGILDNSSLDDGSSSHHGAFDINSLPEGAKILLTSGNPNEVVAFSYQYGSGTVIYSSMPLSAYFDPDWLYNEARFQDYISAAKIYIQNTVEDVANNGTIYETHDSSEVAPLVNDGNNVLSGSLSALDDDVTDTHIFHVVEESVSVLDVSEAGIDLGDVSVSIALVDGVWQYIISGNFTELAAGEKATVTFQYVADDGHGFDGTDGINESSISAPKTITLTITGTNDQPVVSAIDDFAATEALGSGTTSISGVLSEYAALQDDDTHDAGKHLYEINMRSIATNNDSLSISSIELTNTATGAFNIVGDFNALGEGQTAEITFQYRVNDTRTPSFNNESNYSEYKTVTITLTGTNDEVLITSATQAGEVVEDAQVTQATGSVAFTDVDLTDDHTVTAARAPQATDYSVPMGTFTAVETTDTTGSGTGGVVDWTYTINNAAAQQLAAGQSVTEVYTITINDNHGDTVTQDVTITITGTNDIVNITHAITTGDVKEDSLDFMAMGTVRYSDVDITDTHSVSAELTADPYGQPMGTFTVGNFEDSVDGTVIWLYTIDNAAAQQLAAGQSVYETYTITIDDGHGSTATQDVIIEIKGTNDRPVAQNVTDTVTEGSLANDVNSNPNAVYQGAFNFSDVDLTDDYTVHLQDIKVANGHWEGWHYIPAKYASMSIAGNATDIIKASDTQIVVNGDNFELINSYFNNLGVNDSVTITFNYNVTDSSGASNDTSTTKSVSITITGTNDAPVVQAIEVDATHEDATPLTINLLDPSSVSDVDTHDDLDVQNVSVTSNDGHVVVFSVDSETGALIIDPAQFTYLAVNESVDLTVTYQVFDGTIAVDNTATVTIDGRNDIVNITHATSTGDVVEDAQVTQAIGSVAFTDVDLTDEHEVTFAPKSTDYSVPMGTFTTVETTDTTGSGTGGVVDWTYTINNATAQQLAAGQSVTEVYTITINDNNGDTVTQDVTITITGTNDQPVVSAVDAGMVPIVLVSENFENGSVGWSNNATTTGGELTTFLGRFGGTSGNEAISKTFDLGVEHAGQTVTIKFDMYRIDSWDGTGYNGEGEERFQVFVNSQLVSNELNGDTSNFTMTTGNEFTGWGSERINHYEVTATVGADGTIKLGFGSTLHQGLSDESWGIDNLTISQNAIYESHDNTDVSGINDTTDDGLTLFNGNLPRVQDDDSNDSHTYELYGNPTAGVEVVIDPTTGAYEVKGDFNALAAGETQTVTFQYVANDGRGFTGTDGINESSVSEPKTVTLTIIGTNDQPVVADVAAQSIVGEIVLIGDTTTSVDYWNFTHNGGALTVDMLTEIGNNPNAWNQDGTGVYNDINGDGGQTALDVMIRIYALNTDGTRGAEIAVNDDSANYGEDGSLWDRDSYLTIANLAQGNYQLVVGAYDLSASEAASGVNSVDNVNWHYTGPYEITLKGEHGVQMPDKNIVFEATNGLTTFENDLPRAVDADASDTHTYELVSGGEGQNYTVSVDPKGHYTLSGDFNALAVGEVQTITFQYRVKDDSSTQENGESDYSEVATVTINVIGTNDSPIATTSTSSGNEDTSIGVSLAGTDIDGTIASLHVTTLPSVDQGVLYYANGTTPVLTTTALTPTEAANLVFKPALNFNGEVTVSFTVTDNSGAVSAPVNEVITVTPVNDAPTTTPVTLAAIAEDSGVRIITQAELLGNASDIEHDTLTVSNVVISSGTGTLVNNNNGTWSYTPASNDDTSVSFRYTITDNGTTNGASDPKTVTGTATLDITSVNDAPVAVDDFSVFGVHAEYYGYVEGTDGANLSNIAQIRAFMANHTPDALFTPTALDYKLGSGNLGFGSNLQSFLGSDAASLTNDPASTGDAILHLSGNILLNAGTYNFRVTADDGYTILIDGVAVGTRNLNQGPTQTTHSAFTIDTNGEHTIEIIYWDQAGQYQLKVELQQENGGYQVLNVAQSGQVFETLEDTPLVFTPDMLLSNDFDVDGDALSIVSDGFENVQNGSVALVDGNVVFTPTPNYSGEASFEYTISDGHGGTDKAKVTLHVTPVNDAPITTTVALSAIAEDSGAHIITQAMLLANASDIESDALVATNLAIASGAGSLVDNGDGTWTFTPAENDDTSVSFSYTITDNGTTNGSLDAQSIAGSATLDITPVDDVVPGITLNGDNRSDTLMGSIGDDRLNGNGGNDILLGGNGNDILRGGSGNDILNGGSGDDILYGDSGDDTLVYGSGDTMDGVTGIDTLLFTSNTNIDFNAFSNNAQNPIDNIEIFDLTQAKVNLTNLSLQDVIDMTDSNNTLTILGDSGDKVTVDSTLTKTSTETVGGHTFDVYTHTNANDPTVIVKIEQEIQHS